MPQMLLDLSAPDMLGKTEAPLKVDKNLSILSFHHHPYLQVRNHVLEILVVYIMD